MLLPWISNHLLFQLKNRFFASTRPRYVPPASDFPRKQGPASATRNAMLVSFRDLLFLQNSAQCISTRILEGNYPALSSCLQHCRSCRCIWGGSEVCSISCQQLTLGSLCTRTKCNGLKIIYAENVARGKNKPQGLCFRIKCSPFIQSEFLSELVCTWSLLYVFSSFSTF